MTELLDADLHAALTATYQPKDTVRTLAQSRFNTIVSIRPEGVDVMTERSRPNAALVPAWMLNQAWRALHAKGELVEDDVTELRRSSAVVALIARLPGVRIASTSPPKLTLDPELAAR